jgi:hypothetical protein
MMHIASLRRGKGVVGEHTHIHTHISLCDFSISINEFPSIFALTMSATSVACSRMFATLLLCDPHVSVTYPSTVCSFHTPPLYFNYRRIVSIFT